MAVDEDAKPPLKLLTKQVRVKAPINEMIEEALWKFREKYGRYSVEGILLGPNEWTHFRLWSREQPYWAHDPTCNGASYQGLVVHRMSRPGVAMIPSEEAVKLMVVGTVEEREW